MQYSFDNKNFHNTPYDAFLSHKSYIIYCSNGEQYNINYFLRDFARWCALQVLHLWDAPDIVVEYLKTGNEDLRKKAKHDALAVANAAAYAAYAANDAANADAYAAYAANAAAYAAYAANDAANAAAYAAYAANDAANAANDVKEKQRNKFNEFINNIIDYIPKELFEM
jgi:hypothetical protein